LASSARHIWSPNSLKNRPEAEPKPGQNALARGMHIALRRGPVMWMRTEAITIPDARSKGDLKMAGTCKKKGGQAKSAPKAKGPSKKARTKK